MDGLLEVTILICVGVFWLFGFRWLWLRTSLKLVCVCARVSVFVCGGERFRDFLKWIHVLSTEISPKGGVGSTEYDSQSVQ